MTLLNCILDMERALSYGPGYREHNLRTPKLLVGSRKSEYADKKHYAENEEQPVDKRISFPQL
jgi:hypothetical protein